MMDDKRIIIKIKIKVITILIIIIIITEYCNYIIIIINKKFYDINLK